MLSVGWAPKGLKILGVNPSTGSLENPEMDFLITLPSDKLFRRFQAHSILYDKRDLQFRSAIRSSVSYSRLLRVSFIPLVLLVRGDEYINEMIAVAKSVRVPVDTLKRHYCVKASEYLHRICIHPNLTGQKPYDFLALRDRLVKFLTQIPSTLACFYADAMRALIDFVPQSSGLMETMPEELFSWLSNLPSTFDQKDLPSVYSSMCELVGLLLSHEATLNRTIETLALEPWLKWDLEGFFQDGLFSKKLNYMKIEVPQSRGGKKKKRLSPAWRAFSEARAHTITSVHDWAKAEGRRKPSSWIREAIFECLVPALFLTDRFERLMRLAFTVEDLDDELDDEHKKRLNWCLSFAREWRCGSWNLYMKARNDIMRRFDPFCLQYMPKQVLKALSRAFKALPPTFRPRRGGNILHQAFRSDLDGNDTSWSRLLDFADVNELDEDLQAPFFLVKTPEKFLNILCDHRVDLQKHGSSKILAHWSSGRINLHRLEDFHVQRLVHRGLFRDVSDPNVLLPCFNNPTRAPLHAMTLYRTIWSSSISFDLVGSVHRLAFESVVASDQRTVWQGSIERTRVAIVLCSVRATGFRGAIGETPLRILNVDLLRLILANLWHAPSTARW